MQNNLSYDFTQQIKNLAIQAGFDKVGICPLSATRQDARLNEWLQRGYQAGMHWFRKHLDKRLDPALLVPGAKSIVSLAINYYPGAPDPFEHPFGKISRYARGKDYHLVVKDKLKIMIRAIKSWGASIQARGFVDSAPVLEKFWAVQAGLGWQGKNSLLLTEEFGSWVFLGEIITSLELLPDSPLTSRCGTCAICLDACPTRAIVAPGIIDANKCIAYWTVEHKGEIPSDIGPSLGEWVFGCDICQEVCPWNKNCARAAREEKFLTRPAFNALPPDAFESLTTTEFESIFKESPILRCGQANFARSVRRAKENQAENQKKCTFPLDK